MPPERVELLRRWHRDALAGMARSEPITVEQVGLTFTVPPGVYAPNPLGLAELVVEEARPGERVLDMGTGSGVNGIVAAARGARVTAVDVNPDAVACAAANAQRNGVGDRFEAAVGDLFDRAPGRFDLIAFDPPFRWFAAADVAERATADEGYETLTRFFAEAAGHLAPGGRILLSFGNTGDIDYLHELIHRHGFRCEELRRVEGERDGVALAYVAYRLTPG